MTERWQTILGYEGHYEASDQGRVRCVKPRYAIPRIATLTKDASGYLVVNLTVNGVRKQKKVHQLILLAFVGERPVGAFGCHGDNNPENNTLGNLRWDTPRANQHDRFKHGTHTRGDRNPMVKLSELAVRAIKRRLVGAKWGDCEMIALDFGIKPGMVRDIKRGSTWGWVDV